MLQLLIKDIYKWENLTVILTLITYLLLESHGFKIC